MQESITSRLELRCGLADLSFAGHIELDADLGHDTVLGPLGCAEAGLGSPGERPHAVVFGALYPLREVLRVARRRLLDRQAQRIDEQLAALRGLRADG